VFPSTINRNPRCELMSAWINCFRGRLVVVPSAHYRLAFAKSVRDFLAGCVVRGESLPDVIAVELPSSLSSMVGKWIDSLPTPAMVRVRMGEDGAEMLPITPSDSIMTAMWIALELAPTIRPGWAPELALVDIPSPRREEKRGKIRRRLDDWEIHARGQIHPYLSKLPLDQGRDPFDDLREEAMAYRLGKLMNEGRKVLFVCGAAHLKPILGRIARGVANRPGVLDDVAGLADELDFTRITGKSAWKLGWLDDFPAITGAWATSLVEGDAFDKPVAADAVFRRVVEKGLDRNQVSIRPWRAFLRLSDQWRNLRGAWNHDPLRLHGIAKACFGGGGLGMTKLLMEELLRYPHEDPDAARVFSGVRDGRRVYLVVDRNGRGKFGGCMGEETSAEELEVPEDLVPLLPEEIDLDDDEAGGAGGEPSLLGRTTPARADQTLKKVLHRRIHDLTARVLDGPTPPATIVEPYRGGDFGLGLDVRSTIRLRLRGRDGFMIRRSVPPPAPLRPAGGRRSRSRPPIVLVFDSQASGCSTTAGSFHPHDRTDKTFYASFYWFANRKRLVIPGRGSIRSSAIAVCVRLLYEDPERPWKGCSLEPPGPYCETRPWNDGSLRFAAGAPASLALACAIKHAGGGPVSLLAHDGFRVPEEITDFARRQGVRIVRIPVGGFPVGMLERAARDHEAPTAPGTNFRAAAWTDRYVPSAW